MACSPWRIELGASDQIGEIQAVEVRAGVLFRGIGMDSIADADPPTAAELQAHIDSQTLWIAHVQDLVLGYLTTSVVDGEGHIDQVSVDPAAGGRGIGSALIERAIDWATKAGLGAMTLTTFSEVAWNGPFYLKLGFFEVEPAEVGPELARIRSREIANGVDIAPRISMRRLL